MLPDNADLRQYPDLTNHRESNIVIDYILITLKKQTIKQVVVQKSARG